MTAREQLVDETEELAFELFERSHEPSFPDDSQGMEEARDWARSILDRFAKPISAEHVEAAAEAFHNAIGPEDDEGPMYWWHELSEYVRKLSRHDMRVAFRAAGFLIEGDDDAT